MAERGACGCACHNDSILWFIIVFLLLFYNGSGPYFYGREAGVV